MNAVLEFDQVSFGYKEKIFDNINLSINEKDIIGIIGPNGGGKSTLLRLSLGLLRPNNGKVNKYKKTLSYMPQDTNINKDFPITVYDVVSQGSQKNIFGFAIKNDEKNAILESMEILNITKLKDKKISDLSGGERQKALLARAICSKPDILLLDEPTSSIDLNGQKEIYNVLSSLNKNMTIIIVSHDLAVLTRLATRVLYVNNGIYEHKASENNANHFCEIEFLNELTICKTCAKYGN